MRLKVKHDCFSDFELNVLVESLDKFYDVLFFSYVPENCTELPKQIVEIIKQVNILFIP